MVRGVSSNSFQPSLQEVLAAIQSLYDDEIEPEVRMLRRRISEKASPNVEVDAKRLLRTCQRCNSIQVKEIHGGSWVGLLVGVPENFVDAHSLSDNYPSSMWESLSSHFKQNPCLAPGGRYVCAQDLATKQLEFLEGLSLGKICHIVQLGVSHKKILGYDHGSIVAYELSQSRQKDESALMQCSMVSNNGTDMPVATWEQVRLCLQAILADAQTGPRSQGIPVCNVKRFFRSRFHIELSETTLGHAKVSDLLQDSRLSDLLTVDRSGHSHVIRRVEGCQGWTSGQELVEVSAVAPVEEITVEITVKKTFYEVVFVGHSPMRSRRRCVTLPMNMAFPRCKSSSEDSAEDDETNSTVAGTDFEDDESCRDMLENCDAFGLVN